MTTEQLAREAAEKCAHIADHVAFRNYEPFRSTILAAINRAVELERERLCEWPPHKCSFSLTHNEHKNYYQTAAEFLESIIDGPDEWRDPKSRARAIESNEIWMIQVYPDTPIGFYRMFAPTFSELLENISKDNNERLQIPRR